jgi:hypothetical protein
VGGLSLGSILALELYRWHPEIPRSLILASAYAGWAGSLSSEAAEQRRQKVTAMIEAPPEQVAQELLPTLLSEEAPADVVEEVRSIIVAFRREGQRRILRSGFAEIDLREGEEVGSIIVAVARCGSGSGYRSKPFQRG